MLLFIFLPEVGERTTVTMDGVTDPDARPGEEEMEEEEVFSSGTMANDLEELNSLDGMKVGGVRERGGDGYYDII